MTDRIARLVRAQGTSRVFEMEDGSEVERTEGSVSWRNNNPGNLKFEHAGSADTTVRSTRTREQALAKARSRYEGVVDLDQWGNAVFETYEAGRSAKIRLLERSWGDRTVPEMLTSYSTADYSGQTHHNAQAAAIYAEGDRQGVDLRGKRIGDMTPQELAALADGIKRFEGWREGTTRELTPAHERASPGDRPADMPHESSRSGFPVDMRYPDHQDHRLFLQARDGITRLDREHGREPDERSEQLAAALAVQSKAEGLQSISHVALSRDGSRVFAVDTPDIAAEWRKRAHVDVASGMQQPVEASNAQLRQVNEQLAQQQDIAPPLASSLDDPVRLGPRIA